MNEDEKNRQAMFIVKNNSCSGIDCNECFFSNECAMCVYKIGDDSLFLNKIKMYLRSEKLKELNK